MSAILETLAPTPEAQSFAIYVGAAIEMQDDAPELDLRRGDWLVVKPASRFGCDSLHVLKSGEVVRMQQVGCRDICLTRGGGGEEVVTALECVEIIAGRVARVLRR